MSITLSFSCLKSQQVRFFSLVNFYPATPRLAGHYSVSVNSTWTHAQHHTGAQVYAVLNGAAPIDARTLIGAAGGDCMNLFATQTQDPKVLAVAPTLVALDSEARQRKANTLLLAQAADEPGIFFVSSAQPAQRLTGSLIARIDARLSGGGEMMLRWWDARIWLALAHALDEANRHAFFAPVTGALLLDRAGAVTALEHALHTGPDPLDGPLQFTQQEELTMIELGEADAVLSIVRDKHPHALERIEPARRYAWAMRQIAQGREHGVEASIDLALACRIAAQDGDDWWQQAKWKSALEQIKAKRAPFMETIIASTGAA